MELSTEAQAVIDARTLPDLLQALAVLLWVQANPGKDCPEEKIPDESDLVAWRPECPDGIRNEAGERLAVVMGAWPLSGALTVKVEVAQPEGQAGSVSPPGDTPPTHAPQPAPPEVHRGFWQWEFGEVTADQVNLPESMGDGPIGQAGPVRPGLVAEGDVGGIHVDIPAAFACARWRSMPEGERPRHPLAPLVKEWQGRGSTVKPDGRPDAIMHQALFFFAAAAPAIITRRHDNDLPVELGLIDPDAQLPLPGMENPDNDVVPASALVLTDAAGLWKLNPGRGAGWTSGTWFTHCCGFRSLSGGPAGGTRGGQPWGNTSRIEPFAKFAVGRVL